MTDSSTKTKFYWHLAPSMRLRPTVGRTRSWRESVSDLLKDTSVGQMVASTEVWTCVLHLKEGLFTQHTWYISVFS